MQLNTMELMILFLKSPIVQPVQQTWSLCLSGSTVYMARYPDVRDAPTAKIIFELLIDLFLLCCQTSCRVLNIVQSVNFSVLFNT